jgi:hypothetical protein
VNIIAPVSRVLSRTGSGGQQPDATLRGRRRRLLAWAGPIAYLVATVVVGLVSGISYGRERVMLWILVGLLAFSLTDMRRWLHGVVVDWLPFIALLLAYDSLRGIADGALMPAHVYPQMRFDELIAGGTAPTVWLQQHLYTPGHPHWYDVAVTAVYMSHFFATPVLAAILWRFAYERFRHYAALVVGLAFAAFFTYVIFPAVPPWLASKQGVLPPTTRVTGDVWQHIAIAKLRGGFETGRHFANNVAAVPSLHAAFPMLMLLFFWDRGRRWRLAFGLYTLAMGFTLVYTAEHYVFDILLGWLYALAVVVAYRKALEWMSRRRAAQAAPSAAYTARVLAAPTRAGES